MSIFNFSQEEMLSFFGVLVRYSVLAAVLPFIGDRMVPGPLKILFSLAITFALFPSLVASGHVRVRDAAVWGATAGGIVGTIGMEAMFGLAMGFVARLAFDAITFGANLAGTFMGLATASTYDPHQESHTQVVAELQLAIAMLVFLAVDGHHAMLRASLDSYGVVGLGRGSYGAAFGNSLVGATSQVIALAIQLAAPVAVSIFAVNVGFGIMAKAMPQLNVLVLSFSVTAILGLAVLFLSVPEAHLVSVNILARAEDWMEGVKLALAKDGQ